MSSTGTAATRLKSQTAITVDTTETALSWGLPAQSTLNCWNKRLQTVALAISNVGSVDLNSLIVYGRVHGDDDWLVLASGATDYSTPLSHYVKQAQVFTTATGAYVDSVLTTIAAAQTGLLILAVPGLYEIKVTTTTAATSTTVNVFLTGYDADIYLPSPISIEVGDIELGAVELKDGTNDYRAAISSAGVLTVGGAGTAGAPGTAALTVQGIGSGTAVPVSGTVTANAGTNLNTSALATLAKQPALGTAGTASADVISVQGIASGTTLPVTEASGAGIATAVKNRDYKLRCSTRITLGASATVTALLAAGAPAVTLASTDILLLIWPESSSDDIRYTDDGSTAASAATPRWPSSGAYLPCTSAVAAAMRFYFAGTAYMTVQVFTARN